MCKRLSVKLMGHGVVFHYLMATRMQLSTILLMLIYETSMILLVIKFIVSILYL